VYETPADAGLVSPCLDIISRSDKGPNKVTLDAIYHGIDDLHIDALTTLLKNVVALTQDSGRNGQLYPSCNTTYQANGMCPSPMRK
jgi:hypothetical protein